MIHKGDRVVLLKDITYTEVATEDEAGQGVAQSKRGDISRVLRVLRKERKVIVEGVNYRKKAIRPSQDNPRGGWVRKEMPIDISNVMLYSQELGKGVKAKVVRSEDGKKKRVCRKTGEEVPFPSS